MNPGPHIIALTLSTALFTTGCATRSTYVLLPGADGTVGTMTVATEGGRQTLNQANQATRIGKRGVPADPHVMDERKIHKLFGDAIKAQPREPAAFIVYFVSETSVPTSTSRLILRRALTEIGTRNAVEVTITGHADRAGRAKVNERIAAERAHRVARLLVNQGVDERILKVSSFGEAVPLVPTADGVAEPRNRRVEITVR